MKDALKEHLALIFLCLFYMIGRDILSAYIAEQHPEFDYYTLSTILLYILQFYFAACVGIIAFLLIYLIVYSVKNYRAKPFWRRFATTFKNQFLTKQQWCGFIIIFLLIPLFFAFIAMYKQLIPFVNPFCWDKTFMQWDYILHFNHHPWELLQPLIGYPVITTFLARIYGLWFFVLAAVIIWQAITKERYYRMQFLLTFMVSWIILGTIMAYYFSSAGPCFYNTYVSATDNPYLPLMVYLYHAAPPWVIELQNTLLTYLQSNTLIFGGGVSAMPSMHLSMAALCFLICSKHNRWLGLCTFLYMIAILIASVHLAWHYAIDGYVAIIGTILIWYCVGLVLRFVPNTLNSIHTLQIADANYQNIKTDDNDL